MSNKKSKVVPVPLVSIGNTNAAISEQYRMIRSNIQFASVDKEIKTLVVTSSGPGEGKSTTAANLAIVFADSGKRVLLVDTDLRKPSVALTFHLPNAVGLSNLLSAQKKSVANYTVASGIENLWIMTSGPKPPNPSEMLASRRMEETIEELKEQFDCIIFDLPPLSSMPDAQIVASKTDATLLVVRERTTNKQRLARAKKLLEIAKATTIGVVYNAAKRGDDGYYYYK